MTKQTEIDRVQSERVECRGERGAAFDRSRPVEALEEGALGVCRRSDLAQGRIASSVSEGKALIGAGFDSIACSADA